MPWGSKPTRATTPLIHSLSLPCHSLSLFRSPFSPSLAARRRRFDSGRSQRLPSLSSPEGFGDSDGVDCRQPLAPTQVMANSGGNNESVCDADMDNCRGGCTADAKGWLKRGGGLRALVGSRGEVGMS
ncbi:uncharacterized protein [Triticum aestivum]|uniref:uncharacterized protein n=1 Tax=Triticum aestivum TaxID=4565 RepID=UPI001D01B3F4|nr:uncharacterized protein LOC123120492 [Triticum aestivum]